jgi:hypothetical protein
LALTRRLTRLLAGLGPARRLLAAGLGRIRPHWSLPALVIGGSVIWFVWFQSFDPFN